MRKTWLEEDIPYPCSWRTKSELYFFFVSPQNQHYKTSRVAEMPTKRKGSEVETSFFERKTDHTQLLTTFNESFCSFIFVLLNIFVLSRFGYIYFLTFCSLTVCFYPFVRPLIWNILSPFTKEVTCPFEKKRWHAQRDPHTIFGGPRTQREDEKKGWQIPFGFNVLLWGRQQSIGGKTKSLWGIISFSVEHLLVWLFDSIAGILSCIKRGEKTHQQTKNIPVFFSFSNLIFR